MAQLYCPKCQKTMVDTNFYTYKNSEKAEMCKTCQTMHINNWEPETFLWLLEKFDVPYIEAEWNVLRDRAYQKDPYKMTGMSVFGKYLSKMKLKQWKNYTWADTERLKEEALAKAKLDGRETLISDDDLAELKQSLDAGKISEAEFKTLTQIEKPPEYKSPYTAEGALPLPPPPQGPTPTGFPDNGYPINANPYEQVELVDVGAELDDEDKKYLAMKWGILYKPSEWVSLEQLYEEFMKTFDIQGAAREDTLKMICKTSLKMNQAIDCGDVDSYQKLSRVYDALMKSAKFTEAQRKEEKSGQFDSAGQIVFFAEKYKGKIPRFNILEYYDGIDEKMDNLKRYNKELIMNDSALAQMIENYIMRREAAENQKEDLVKAKENGLDYVEINDEDYEEFYKLKNGGEEEEIENES